MMKQISALILLMISLTACKKNVQTYVTVEGGNECCTMKIPIGKDEGKVQLSISKMMKLSYFSGVEEAKNLKFLDVQLFIDGKEILPVDENYEAVFSNVYRPEKYKPIAKEDCCKDLEKKLGFNKSQANENYLFIVEITKNYESLENLPPNIEVLLTAITDQGTFTKRRKLKLITYEEYDFPFIRFH